MIEGHVSYGVGEGDSILIRRNKYQYHSSRLISKEGHTWTWLAYAWLAASAEYPVRNFTALELTLRCDSINDTVESSRLEPTRFVRG